MCPVRLSHKCRGLFLNASKTRTCTRAISFVIPAVLTLEDSEMEPASLGRRLALQLTFNMIMLFAGASLAVRGAALRDLAEEYDSDVATMGLALIAAGVASFVSCASVGPIMDWAGPSQHWVMGLYLALCALSLLLMPYGAFFWIFWLLNFVFSFANCSFWVLTNTFCLQIWRQSHWGPGPFMHSLFLFYIVGFFVSPLVAAPFLSRTPLIEETAITPTARKGTRVNVLFIVLGMLHLLVAVAICLLGKGIGGDKESANGEKESEQTCHSDVRETEESRMPANYAWKRRLLVAIIANFYLVDYTMLMGICNFLISAVVHSDLALSKSDGAFLISVFFMGQMVVAAVNSILSRWLSPNQILSTCLSLMAVSSMIMLLAWNENHLLLQGSLFALGLGTGSMLANTMVWLDQFVPLDTKSVGFMQSFAGFGLMASGAIFAPNVEQHPIVLPLFSVAMVICFVAIFGAGALLGRHLCRQRAIFISQSSSQ